MNDTSGQRLSYREAARLIYRTDEPNVVQISKIDFKVARGALRGNRGGQWVTAESVTAYLAARAEQSRLAPRAGRRGHSEPPSGSGQRGPDDAIRGEGKKVLPPIYRRGLQDYFSAVLRRRQPDGASAGFARAVLAGQIVLILFPVVVIGTLLATAAAPPPERTAVEAFLERDTRQYAIVQWFPSQPAPEGGGVLVHVKYRYTPPSGGRPVVTDRVFLVRGDQVTRAALDD